MFHSTCNGRFLHEPLVTFLSTIEGRLHFRAQHIMVIEAREVLSRFTVNEWCGKYCIHPVRPGAVQ